MGVVNGYSLKLITMEKIILKESESQEFYQVSWNSFKKLSYAIYRDKQEKVFLKEESAIEFAENLKVCSKYLNLPLDLMDVKIEKSK